MVLSTVIMNVEAYIQTIMSVFLMYFKTSVYQRKMSYTVFAL